MPRAKKACQSATQIQDEDSLSFLSAVLGALGSTMTTTSAGSQTLLVGVLLAAVAKTLPSLKEDHKSLEDWILFIFAILGAFAAGIEASMPRLVYSVHS